MEGKKIRVCGQCGESGHDKRTCPQKEVDDTSLREVDDTSLREVDDTSLREVNEEYIEESITIDPKREVLIKLLLDREAYEISTDVFEMWLINKRPCNLKEVKHLMDRNLNTDSIIFYLRMLEGIDSLL